MFFAVSLIALSACNNGEPGTWKNDDIYPGIKQDFHEMNDLLFKSLKANKPVIIEKIMSKPMLNDPNINRVVELSSIRMRKGKITMLDEYYMVHEFNKESKVQSTGHGINDYALTYTPTSREMYVCFYIIKDGLDKWMLSATYNKLDYGWKLTDLDLSSYTMSGKTSPELYQLAKQQYAKGYIIDAVNTMNLSRSSSLPNVMWSYQQKEDMNSFYSKLLEEAQNLYNFPVPMVQLATKPKIFRVFNQSSAEGYFPMIYYVSQINLKDTAALKEENREVRKVIGRIIPGIDKDKNMCFIRCLMKCRTIKT